MTTPPSPISDYPLGTVVVVPFPYSDRLSEKRRPALVVSGPEIEAAGLLWIVMITTARRVRSPLDVAIDGSDAAGLSAPCVVRPVKIACIEPSRVLRRAGRVSPAVAAAVVDRVRSFVGSPA